MLLNKKKRLVDGSLRNSLMLSVAVIFFIQLLFLTVLFVFTRININRRASVTADEIAEILQEPMYNVDDAGVKKIADALMAAGRIEGLRIVSNATGQVYNSLGNDTDSLIVALQKREVLEQGLNLGNIYLKFSDSEFWETVYVNSMITFILVLTVSGVNIWVNRTFILKKVKTVFASVGRDIKKIRAGSYDTSIELSGYDDVDSIIASINDMSQTIVMQNRELREINETLELRVKQRTVELERSVNELEKMQNRVVESGKLSVLGQLAAGIAHEFNTPLGAIISTTETLIAYVDKDLFALYDFRSTLSEEESSLYQYLLEIGFEKGRSFNPEFIDRQTIKQLSEKLNKHGVSDARQIAVLLTEMQTHVNIDDYIEMLKGGRASEIVSFVANAVAARRMIAVIEESARRAAQVVSAFKQYLGSGLSATIEVVRVEEDLNRVLVLLQNILKKGVSISTSFSGLAIRGVSDKLNQVWINIIRNAVQAMDGKGKLQLITEKSGDMGIVKIIDSGKGIPEHNQNQIFDPFFTTRESGEGMGLGLDICRRIVNDLGGTIDFHSKPGHTEFIVALPLA
ncbi:MAG TPA: ATP-binding protein [Spirochaetota bacterium]|nr:ATP-binding protein [Spirochaetota bacterium]